MSVLSRIDTFVNPAGIIEQHYIGLPQPPAMEAAVKKLKKLAARLSDQKKTILILVDVTDTPVKPVKIDLESNRISIEVMKNLDFKRIALYGPVVTQVMLNTLAMVVGKKDKVAGFHDRNEAIRWLRTGKL